MRLTVDAPKMETSQAHWRSEAAREEARGLAMPTSGTLPAVTQGDARAAVQSLH